MNKPYKKEKKTKQAKVDEKTGNRNRKYLLIAGGIIALAIVVTVGFIFLNPIVAMTGDNVSVFYTLTFENGTVIDTNMNETPLALTIGSANIIPGFSNAIIGMGVNQKKTVIIPYGQAYGPYRSDLIRTVNRTGAIANTTFIVGQHYTVHSPATNAISTIKILNVTPSTVTWDENHPLAGQNLTFTIQIVSVNKGTGINAVLTNLPTIPTSIPI